MDEIFKKNEQDSADDNSIIDSSIDINSIDDAQEDEIEEKHIIEIEDAELDDDLQDLIIEPMHEDENEGNGERPTQPSSTSAETEGSDEDDGYVQYVHRDHSNTLSRSAIINELTDLTLLHKKTQARSMVGAKSDTSITLESDKSLSRDDVEDLIAKLTS